VTERHTKTYRQTQTDIKTDRQTGEASKTHTKKQIELQNYRLTDRHIDREIQTRPTD